MRNRNGEMLTDKEKGRRERNLERETKKAQEGNICVCVCVCVYIHIYIYIYRERERERERWRERMRCGRKRSRASCRERDPLKLAILRVRNRFRFIVISRYSRISKQMSLQHNELKGTNFIFHGKYLFPK